MINVIKPVLKDQELKKFMYKELGKRFMSGISDLQEDQIQQLK
jgi:hypothetical protein